MLSLSKHEALLGDQRNPVLVLSLAPFAARFARRSR